MNFSTNKSAAFAPVQITSNHFRLNGSKHDATKSIIHLCFSGFWMRFYGKRVVQSRINIRFVWTEMTRTHGFSFSTLKYLPLTRYWRMLKSECLCDVRAPITHFQEDYRHSVCSSKMIHTWILTTKTTTKSFIEVLIHYRQKDVLVLKIRVKVSSSVANVKATHRRTLCCILYGSFEPIGSYGAGIRCSLPCIHSSCNAFYVTDLWLEPTNDLLSV